VHISAALAAHLAVLTAALENPEVDLESELRAFASDVKRAVASYTGLAITIALDGHNVSFAVDDDPTTARSAATSLLIRLPALTTSDAASTLVLYAATPGAFVDLAADLSYALGVDPATLALDAHLPALEVSSGIAGLHTHFAIDQAIGVLIGNGHTPESARDELHRLTNLDHGGLRAAAEQVILHAARPTPPDHRRT
jgi:hypothetical protein